MSRKLDGEDPSSSSSPYPTGPSNTVAGHTSESSPVAPYSAPCHPVAPSYPPNTAYSTMVNTLDSNPRPSGVSGDPSNKSSMVPPGKWWENKVDNPIAARGANLDPGSAHRSPDPSQGGYTLRSNYKYLWSGNVHSCYPTDGSGSVATTNVHVTENRGTGLVCMNGPTTLPKIAKVPPYPRPRPTADPSYTTLPLLEGDKHTKNTKTPKSESPLNVKWPQ